MAQPTVSMVHIDYALSNISLAYIQSADAFIANRVFPMVPVPNQTNKYYVYTKNDWFRDEAQIRPPGTESAGSGYNLTTDNYSCDVYALHKDIDDQTLKNADAAINLEREAAMFVVQRMLVKREIEWAASFFGTSIWGTDVTGGTNFAQWDNYATSKPLVDVQAGKTTVLSTTGFEPNTLVLGYQVYAALLNHPEIVDRIKYTSSDAITQQILARYFGVDNLFVAKAVKATNVEGETAAYGFTHGKHALLCYVPSAPGLLTPSAGYTFAWSGVSDGAGLEVGTVRFYEQKTRSWRIESQMAWDSKKVAGDLGYFFASAVS